MAIEFINGEALKVKEPEIVDSKMIANKDKIDLLIKTIMYIGRESEDIERIASDLFDNIYGNLHD